MTFKPIFHGQANLFPFEFTIPNSEFRIPNSEFRILKFRIPNSEFRILNSEFRIPNFENLLEVCKPMRFHAPGLEAEIRNIEVKFASFSDRQT